MKNRMLAGAALMILMVVQVQAEEQKPLKTAKEKSSYAVGVDLVRNFKHQGIDADLAAVIRGMQDESTGKKLQMTETEISETLKDYNRELKTKQAQLRQQTRRKEQERRRRFPGSQQDQGRGRDHSPAACSTRSSRLAAARNRPTTTA